MEDKMDAVSLIDFRHKLLDHPIYTNLFLDTLKKIGMCKRVADLPTYKDTDAMFQLYTTAYTISNNNMPLLPISPNSQYHTNDTTIKLFQECNDQDVLDTLIINIFENKYDPDNKRIDYFVSKYESEEILPSLYSKQYTNDKTILYLSMLALASDLENYTIDFESFRTLILANINSRCAKALSHIVYVIDSEDTTCEDLMYLAKLIFEETSEVIGEHKISFTKFYDTWKMNIILGTLLSCNGKTLYPYKNILDHKAKKDKLAILSSLVDNIRLLNSLEN